MSSIEIEIVENGYEICFDDPEIVKANHAPSKGKMMTSWADPEKCFVFKTAKEVVDFVATLLPKLEPSGDDATEFSKAFKDVVSAKGED